LQRRTLSHTGIGIVGATTGSFILFENGVRRNRLVLPRHGTESRLTVIRAAGFRAGTSDSSSRSCDEF
jgi:hypothetical protein